MNKPSAVGSNDLSSLTRILSFVSDKNMPLLRYRVLGLFFFLFILFLPLHFQPTLRIMSLAKSVAVIMEREPKQAQELHRQVLFHLLFFHWWFAMIMKFHRERVLGLSLHVPLLYSFSPLLSAVTPLKGVTFLLEFDQGR
jgi:hypothetical protein